MLRNSDLFALIKSLDLNERRYLVKTGRKEPGNEIGYVEILQSLAALNEYSEEAAKNIISLYSKSDKTDVKKHYLYYWILRKLHEFNYARYKETADLNNVKVLIDRSLYEQAARIIPAIKKKFISSESYPELLILLELELKIIPFARKSNPAIVLEEVQGYSKQYADLKTLQLIRFKLRKILDINIFVRSEADKKHIDKIIDDIFKLSINKTSGNLLQYNFNIILYWKHATANDWENGFRFAYQNYQLLCAGDSQIRSFPDETIHSFFNVLNTSFVAGKDIYSKVLREFRKNILKLQTNRLRNDSLFFIHLSQLIHFNQNFHSAQSSAFIQECFDFINHNRNQISRVRLNNFYFDLAKSLFYLKEYKQSFSVLNDIYQNLNISGHTRDFYTHSRILFCLCCFEKEESELMRSSARSAEEYMKRNEIYYRFEKRFVGFIVRDLFRFETMRNNQKLQKLDNLKKDLLQIFESPYEKTVLNYFDYIYWVNLKIEQMNIQKIHI